MAGYREAAIERAPLHRKGVYVVAVTFGGKKWECRVGRVEDYRKNTVEVVFNDDDGQPFSWRFSMRTGFRTQDVGVRTGWRINLDDLKDWKPAATVHKPKVRVKKVHEELVELSNGKETVVWQVFKDETTGRLYFKSFRRTVDPDTGKVKERPYAAPIEKVLEVLHQFITDW